MSIPQELKGQLLLLFERGSTGTWLRPFDVESVVVGVLVALGWRCLILLRLCGEVKLWADIAIVLVQRINHGCVHPAISSL